MMYCMKPNIDLRIFCFKNIKKMVPYCKCRNFCSKEFIRELLSKLLRIINRNRN